MAFVAMIVSHTPHIPWIPGMEDDLPIGHLVVETSKSGLSLENIRWAWTDENFGPYYISPLNLEILGDL